MIALYEGRSFLSRVIRCFNWSPYSHAAWVCTDDLDQVDEAPVQEAWWPRVRMVRNLHDGHTQGTLVHVYDIVPRLAPAERAAIEEFMQCQVGRPYDLRGVIHFLTRRPEGVRDQDRWFCSELVFAACRRAGVELLCNVPAYKVYPGMLAYSPRLRQVATVAV